MLPLGRNKVPGQIKQGGGPDSAQEPCVCHLSSRLKPTKPFKQAAFKQEKCSDYSKAQAVRNRSQSKEKESQGQLEEN